MKIRVLFFSHLVDLTGRSEEERFVEGGATIGDLLEELYREHPDLKKWDDRLLTALDCEYANREQPLREGAELALFPPVQGG